MWIGMDLSEPKENHVCVCVCVCSWFWCTNLCANHTTNQPLLGSNVNAMANKTGGEGKDGRERDRGLREKRTKEE
jgi:hypothetical protein